MKANNTEQSPFTWTSLKQEVFEFNHQGTRLIGVVDPAATEGGKPSFNIIGINTLEVEKYKLAIGALEQQGIKLGSFETKSFNQNASGPQSILTKEMYKKEHSNLVEVMKESQQATPPNSTSPTGSTPVAPETQVKSRL